MSNNALVQSTLDVHVADPPVIDPYIYSLWLQGYTFDAATALVQKKKILYAQSEVVAQYRLFNMLKPVLNTPKLFMNMNNQFILVQWPQSVRQNFINKYFTFDDAVVRELVCKKLSSSKIRKDLDDISEKLQIELSSCRRQFENITEVIKRVSRALHMRTHPKATSSMVHNQMSITQMIQHEFFLEEPLAKKYAAIIFITHYKIECSKRRLKELTFVDLYDCALFIMQYWTSATSHNPLKLQLDFAALREVKNMLLADREKKLDEFRDLVKQKLVQATSSSNDKFEQDQQLATITLPDATRITEKFSLLLKNLLSIASSIAHDNIKDILLDVQEKFVDFWLSKLKVNAETCRIFWEKSIECFASLSHNYSLVHHFTCFLCAIRECSLGMMLQNNKKK